MTSTNAMLRNFLTDDEMEWGNDYDAPEGSDTGGLCRILRWDLDRADSQTISTATERWTTYLRSLASRNLATVEVGAASERLWLVLSDRVHDLTPPDAAPTGNGGLLVSWDTEGQHLEIEILQDTSYEWFYRERAADMSDSGEEDSVDTVQDRLAELLEQMLG